VHLVGFIIRTPMYAHTHTHTTGSVLILLASCQQTCMT